MNYEVFGKKVLIRKSKVKEESGDGFVIPEAVRKPPSTGIVCGVGPDVTFVKEGDSVVFSRYAGMFLEDTESLEESEIIVLEEEEILVKVKT